MGDLTADQMWAVADPAERYSNGNIRTTINQNMVIRWIPKSRLEAFHGELVAHSLGDPVPSWSNIIACPGTDTCGLGILVPGHGPRTGRSVSRRSGAGRFARCQRSRSAAATNSCAQHHIATIPGCNGSGSVSGAYGAALRTASRRARGMVRRRSGQLAVKLPAVKASLQPCAILW